MSLKDLQIELLDEYEERFYALIQIAYMSDKYKWPDIYELATKKAAAEKMMIDHLKKEIKP